MAEYLFKQKIGDDPDWEISSAGTYTRNGLPTNNEVLTTLRKYEIDASSHRTSLITRRKIHNHNLVLCLASNHKEALQVEFPDMKDRIYLLSEMVGKTTSVDDPIGGPLVEYEAAAREIDGYLTEGFERIIALAS
jgi:protein-tyrosine phosphatase